METPASVEKLGQEGDVAYASSSTGEVITSQKPTWAYLRHYFTSREGWIGDYVCLPLPSMSLTDTNIRRTISTSSHPTSGP
jgi:hypothetical protein